MTPPRSRKAERRGSADMAIALLPMCRCADAVSLTSCHLTTNIVEHSKIVQIAYRASTTRTRTCGTCANSCPVLTHVRHLTSRPRSSSFARGCVFLVCAGRTEPPLAALTRNVDTFCDADSLPTPRACVHALAAAVGHSSLWLKCLSVAWTHVTIRFALENTKYYAGTASKDRVGRPRERAPHTKVTNVSILCPRAGKGDPAGDFLLKRPT